MTNKSAVDEQNRRRNVRERLKGWFGASKLAVKRILSRWWHNFPLTLTTMLIAASALATYVLYVSGLPWRFEDNSGDSLGCTAFTTWSSQCWRFEMLTMADRLKVAAGVITAIAALTALLISFRKQLEAEHTRFDAKLSAAVTQLANQSPTVRIAGVYAIAELADRTYNRRQECIDVLCGYLRVPCTTSADDAALTTATTSTTGVNRSSKHQNTRTYHYVPYDKEVRNTIVRVISTHLQPDAKKSWSKLNFDFTGAHFFGTDFGGAYFEQNVSFENAYFVDSAWFDNAQFAGPAWFYAAHFAGPAQFQNAHFAGPAWFYAAHFIKSASFEKVRFAQEPDFAPDTFKSEAHFDGATLRGEPYDPRDKADEDVSGVTDVRDGERVVELPSDEPESSTTKGDSDGHN